MTQHPPRRLARFVEPDVDDRRVDRVWASIASLPVRSWPAWRMTALTGAVVVAAAVVVLLRPRPTSNGLEGVVIESGPAQTVTLPDGSSATLRDRARMRYDRVQSDRVEATVERGEVAFDVRHTGSRTFVVHAGAFDVVDRGTRFVVGVEGENVRVSVETGSVEVARTHGSEPKRTLAGGESWTNAPSAAAAPTAAAPVVQPSAPDSPAAEVSAAAPSSPADSARAQAPPTPGPRELLQEANDARLAGHPRDAAAAFDQLRRRYRSDPRAGLAAFELGRLRLDSLGDPSGAAEALADSISLAPGATFREDAEARLVEALDRSHDGRCAAARQGYLVRFPNGLHAASVAARCP